MNILKLCAAAFVGGFIGGFLGGFIVWAAKQLFTT